MRRRRYHRVREGQFPPSGRADDGPRPPSVTLPVGTDESPAPPPTFESGLPGLIAELKWRGMFHDASEGLEARFASNRPITAYNGFDPVRAVAPHRPPRADLRADPPPAPRRQADRAGRRRHGHDRGSVGPIERAEPPVARPDRGQCRLHPAAARAVPRLLRPARRDHGQQRGLARAAPPARLPSRHRASTSRSRTCWPRTRSRSGWRVASRSPSSATC